MMVVVTYLVMVVDIGIHQHEDSRIKYSVNIELNQSSVQVFPDETGWLEDRVGCDRTQKICDRVLQDAE